MMLKFGAPRSSYWTQIARPLVPGVRGSAERGCRGSAELEQVATVHGSTHACCPPLCGVGKHGPAARSCTALAVQRATHTWYSAISAPGLLRGLPGQNGDVDGARQAGAAGALDGQVDTLETEVMGGEQVQRVLARGDALDGQL